MELIPYGHFQTLSAWLTSNNSDLLVLDYNDIIEMKFMPSQH